MTDATRSAVVASLKVAEGTGPMRHGRHMPYTDSVGVLTIGYGCAIGVTGLTRDEAEYLLESRIRIAISDLDFLAAWWRELDEARQAACVEMMYQLGADRFMGFHKFRAAMQRRDFEQAAAEMIDSQWHKQATGRVERLAAIIRGHA